MADMEKTVKKAGKTVGEFFWYAGAAAAGTLIVVPVAMYAYEKAREWYLKSKAGAGAAAAVEGN